MKAAAAGAALIVAGWLIVAGMKLREPASSEITWDAAFRREQKTAVQPFEAPQHPIENAKLAAADAAKVPNIPPLQNPVEVPAPPPQNQADYAPPPEVEAHWKEAVELLPLVDPERDAIVGKWSLNGHGLETAPEKCSRMAIPYQPPEEYDFRADFTRIKNGFDIVLIFPIRGQGHFWMMDSWQACGFGGTWKNPDAVPTPGIANHVRHTVIVEVRKNTLRAFLDGHLLQSMVLWKSRSQVYADWRLPDESMAGIGAWNSGVVFHRVSICPVTGEGRMAPPDPDAPIVSAEHWKDAVDLTPRALNPQNAIAGRWTAANGELQCAADQNARYELGYQPPEEYDYRMTFTRRSGEDEIAQIVSAAGRQFAWKVAGRSICSLDTIDGQTRNERAATLKTPGIASIGKTTTSIVCVRKTGVKAYIDGKLMAYWPTRFTDMGIEKAWKLRSPVSLGVGALLSETTLQKTQIKEVTGKGRQIGTPNKAGDVGEF